jgi:hypothetical protein
VVQVVALEESPPSVLIQRPQPALIRFWRQIGGGSLLLSIGVHGLVLLLAGAVIIGTQVMRPPADFLPAGRTQAGEEATRALTELVRVKHQASLARRQPVSRIVVDGPGEFDLPEAGPSVLPEANPGISAAGGRLSPVSAGVGPGSGIGMNGSGPSRFLAALPDVFGSRCSNQSRLEKLRQNGGTLECELAVSRSLAWLKTQQNTDGSWGRTNRAAMTGLTLLCFLGCCETPESPYYGDNVRSGLFYLVELARKNPHGILSENPLSNPATYEHGIATYALGEMYSFYRLGNSSLPGLREVFENGVKIIIGQQNKRGSWAYGGKDAGMPHAYNKESGGEEIGRASCRERVS